MRSCAWNSDHRDRAGSGGQATERLLELGADPLVAIEPDGALAAFLVDRFGDRVRVHTVPFEAFDGQASAFSLAVSATAFHWIDRSRGLSQVARTLRPGGWWAMWWTIYHDPTRTDPLYEALVPILGELPRAPGGGNRNGPAATFAFDRAARRRELQHAGFDKVKIDVVRWKLDLDPASARALFAAFSPVLALPDDHRAATLAAVERVVADGFGGQVERPVVTILYTAQRPVGGVIAAPRGAKTPGPWSPS